MNDDFNAVFHIWFTLLMSTRRFDCLNKLLEIYHTPDKIYAIKKQDELPCRVAENERLCQRILDDSFKKEAEKIYADARKRGIGVCSIADDNYPCFLREMYSPPLVLYYYGSIEEDYRRTVSVVGSRNADGYGRKVAYDLSKDLAFMGMTTISGMARGVDSYAHKGSLDGGGRTIAVLGCGVDYVYPPENKQLYSRIIENGAVVSDYIPGTSPQKQFFPARNRIIAGLSMGTVVVQARKSSGALITSDSALKENRTVYAVPGNINCEMSQGTNDLIRNGCVCVTCARDIVEDMGFELMTDEMSQEGSCGNAGRGLLTNEERAVYEALRRNVSSAEEVCRTTNLDVQTVLSAVTMLKVHGLVEGIGFGSYVAR